MNEEGNTRGTRRYVALDIHKHYCVIAAVDREGRVVLQAVRVEHADLEAVSYTHLTLPTICSVYISVVAVSLKKVF